MRETPSPDDPVALGEEGAARPGRRRPNGRWQLPAWSPLTLRDTIGAFGSVVSGGDAARERLRRRLCADFHADEAVLCDSGTSALQLALLAADRMAPGPHVAALPAFTCFEVAAAAIGAGAHIALYDLDPETLAPDLGSVERVLREGAKSLVVAPLFGVPVEWHPLRELAERHGVTAIEDAAQGHGAALDGLPLGSHGPLSVLSFGRGKGWSGGGGGALLTRREGRGSVRGRASSPELHGNGRLRDAEVVGAGIARWALGRPALYALPASLPWLGLGQTRYRPPSRPARMAGASAEMLLRTADAARREATARRSNGAAYLRAIPTNAAVSRVRAPAGEAGWLRFPLLLAGGVGGFPEPERARRLGVEPGYPSTLAALDPVRSRLWRRGDRLPGAEELVRKLVTLPTHSLTTEADREAILRLLARYPARARAGDDSLASPD